MSVSEAFKTYAGPASRVILAGAIVYGVSAVAARFDRIPEMVDAAREITVQMNETAGKVDTLRAGLKEDAAAARAALPQVGTEFGAAGANAVEKMDELLACPEGDTACVEGQGIRGAVKSRLDGLFPGR